MKIYESDTFLTFFLYFLFFSFFFLFYFVSSPTILECLGSTISFSTRILDGALHISSDKKLYLYVNMYLCGTCCIRLHIARACLTWSTAESGAGLIFRAIMSWGLLTVASFRTRQSRRKFALIHIITFVSKVQVCCNDCCATTKQHVCVYLQPFSC